MKKLLIVAALAPMMALAVAWENVSGTATVNGQEWYYTGDPDLNGLRIMDTGYPFPASTVRVPSSINAYPVMMLEMCGCTACSPEPHSYFTAIDIPEGIQSVGTQCFYGQRNLKNVHLPKSLKELGSQAFAGVPGPFYFHGSKPKVVSDDVWTSPFFGFGYDESRSVANDRVVYFVRGESGWVDGGEWCGLRTYAWDPAGGGSGSGWTDKHTFNGLVSDFNGEPCGLIQVTTAKATKKGVKVSGFVVLEDGKKVTMKAVTVSANEQLGVYASVGRIGNISLTVTESGFSGSLGSMKVASTGVGEDTGILKATVTMSYFEAGTGKLKTKSLTMNGITVDGVANGTLLNKKTKSTNQFWAEVECSSCSPSR